MEVRGVPYCGPGKHGDFKWMLQQSAYTRWLFVFNDNVVDAGEGVPHDDDLRSEPANWVPTDSFLCQQWMDLQSAGGLKAARMSRVRNTSHMCRSQEHAYVESFSFLTHFVCPMALLTQWSPDMRTPSGSCRMALTPATVVGSPAKLMVARESGAVPADVIF